MLKNNYRDREKIKEAGAAETQGLSIKEKAAKLRNILQEKSMSATDTKAVDNPSEETATTDTSTNSEAE